MNSKVYPIVPRYSMLKDMIKTAMRDPNYMEVCHEAHSQNYQKCLLLLQRANLQYAKNSPIAQDVNMQGTFCCSCPFRTLQLFIELSVVGAT